MKMLHLPILRLWKFVFVSSLSAPGFPWEEVLVNIYFLSADVDGDAPVVFPGENGNPVAIADEGGPSVVISLGDGGCSDDIVSDCPDPSKRRSLK